MLRVVGHHAGTNPTIRRASWTVWILPFIEEAAVYDRFRPTSASIKFGALRTPTSSEDSMKLAEQNTPLSIDKCPSDIAQRAAQPSLNYFGWSSSNRLIISAKPLVLAAAVDPINTPLVDYDASKAWVTTASPTNALWLGTHTRCFGSRHPGGCHMAMAYDSAQFFQNSILTTIYRQFVTREDGQPVGVIE